MKGYVENAKVERVFDTRNGVGVAVVEESESNGETYRNWCTLWFKGQPNERVQVGDRVNGSGFVSARARMKDGEPVLNREGRPVVDVNLNGARIQSVVPGSVPAQEPPADDPWASEGPGW